MISMTAACTTWCIKLWICGWSYWLNTISSTMITFSLVHVRCFRLPCFGSISFWKFTFHKVVQRHGFGCGEIFDDCFMANFPKSVPLKEFWKSVENLLSYQYELGVPHFLEHGVGLYSAYQCNALTIKLLFHLSYKTNRMFCCWLHYRM